MFLRTSWLESIQFYRKYSTNELRKGIYKSVVGLEVHAQILSNSKLFSGAANDHASASNTAVALFDASIPGTLPRINERCVEAAIKTSMSLGCRLNQISTFDRKHYFYADSPAGFQITQQRLPLAVDGEISFLVTNAQNSYMKTSRIHQIQLEQDSGRSLHFPEDGVSMLDLNRAGVPLMELVFEPDLTSGEEAASLLKELSIILTRLEVCSCRAHSMRCDANISVHRPGEPLGVRSEVKNIASIGNVAKAVEYEIVRHIELVESGERIVNETRAWDDQTKTTIRMRDKEVVQDYRFMPEPNLPPLNLAAFDLNAIRKSLPAMPNDTRRALVDYELQITATETFVKYTKLMQLFLDAASKTNNSRTQIAANLIRTSVLGACNKLDVNINDCPLTTKNFQTVVDLLLDNEINYKVAEGIIFEAIKTPSLSAIEYIEQNNLTRLRDRLEIREICDECIAKYDKVARKAQRGKKSEFDKLLSLVIKESKHRADYDLAKSILHEALN